jgi:hypothetical protein
LAEEAIVIALKQGMPYFQNIWDEAAGPIGQRWLEKIARSRVAGTLTLENKDDHEAISNLIQHLILARTDEGYTVRAPLIRRWILKYAPRI